MASAIIVWMLTTLEWKEIAAAGGLIRVAGAIYGFCERKRPETAGIPAGEVKR